MVQQQQPQPQQQPQQQQPPPPDPNQQFSDLNTLTDVRLLRFFFTLPKENSFTNLVPNRHLLSILTSAHWRTLISSKTSISIRSLIPMQTRRLGLIQTYPMPQMV